MSLQQQIDESVVMGCYHASLGIQQMPDGYALMLDADEAYYFWLRHDGVCGPINWNKWAVRRGAMANANTRPASEK